MAKITDMPDGKEKLPQFYCVCPIENGSDVGLPPLWDDSVLKAVAQDKSQVAALGRRRRRTDAQGNG